MASSPTAFAPQKPLEDPLAHLPCSSIVEYRKGQMIYNQDQPSTAIYLVIDGKVKVSRLADDGHQVNVRAGGISQGCLYTPQADILLDNEVALSQ